MVRVWAYPVDIAFEDLLDVAQSFFVFSDGSVVVQQRSVEKRGSRLDVHRDLV